MKEFATAHIQAAQQEYGAITARVRSRDRALDREFHAAFPVITGQIAQRLPALAVTNRMGLVQGQLLDAGIRDAVGPAAFNDPGVSACSGPGRCAKPHQHFTVLSCAKAMLVV